MSTTTISYGDGFLNIRIPTAAPAAMHNLLLKGLVTSLKNPLLTNENNPDDVDGLLVLAKVLSHSIPDESHLRKAYQRSPAQ